MKARRPGRKGQTTESVQEPVDTENLDALFYDPPKNRGVPMATKLDELQQQIDALQKQRDELLETEKAEAIEQINAMIKTYGIKVGDLNLGYYPAPVRTSGRTKGSAAAKYESNGRTWTGRGRKPRWVDDHLKSGGTLDDLLIK